MIKIGDHIISSKHLPVLVAEISSNHNGSWSRMVSLIKQAHKIGIKVIKIQTYTADTMTLNIKKKEFLIKNSKYYKGSLYDLYKKAHTPWIWHNKIFQLCKKLNMVCFSTPFDETAVDFLEKLNVPAYKISSFECTDFPLIKKIANTGKPTIISTGMCSKKEIQETVKYFKKNSKKKNNLILLKCTSSYPAKSSDLNLMTIQDMKKTFNCEIGFSDHSIGNTAPIVAASLGAVIIEKHFNISDKVQTPDSHFSGSVKEFSELVIKLKEAFSAKGKVYYGSTNSEKNTKLARRSIYFVKNINKGEKIKKNHIKLIRPGLGLEPKYYEAIINKKILKDAKFGQPTSWKFFKK